MIIVNLYTSNKTLYKIVKNLGVYMGDANASAMFTIAVGSILWLVMMIMVLKNEFHNRKVKIAWIVAFIICPPSALLFPFIGMKHIK